MATTPKKDSTSDTGVLQDKPTTKAAEHGDHDRIAMPSVRADGSWDQNNPEVIGDLDTAVQAAREQAAVRASSAVDVAARGVTTEPEDAGSSEPDAEVKALKEAQEKAANAAADAAERDIKARHKGLGA